MDSTSPLIDTNALRDSSQGRVQVAVVRSDNRRGALAQALALIADDIGASLIHPVVIKPGMARRCGLVSPHADILSALLDALFSAGAPSVTVAEGGKEYDLCIAYERLGYFREAWGRAVEFVVLDPDEAGWESLELAAAAGSTCVARVATLISEARYRISLTVAQTDPFATVALGLGNMVSAIHPDDRKRVRGDSGRARGRWLRLLDGDGYLSHRFARLRRPDKAHWQAITSIAADNLVRLAMRTRPHMSVVAGFGRRFSMMRSRAAPHPRSTVVAGIDAVTVDAVAAAVMGFNPREIAYLVRCQEAGLGIADLENITVLGDPITPSQRRPLPRSNSPILKPRSDRFEHAQNQPHF